MSKFITKVVTGFSTVAMAVAMLATPATSHAAMAGEVYKTTDGTVWFITKDMQRRPFTSWGAFLSYGFLSGAQIKEADSSVTSLSAGSFIAPQDGRIFCATETKGSDVAGECALITGGKKARFTSAQVFTGQGYSFSRAYSGDSSFLENITNIDNASAQHRPGTLINNSGTVQLVVSGGLWGVPSMDVFNAWGWSFADVVPANSADVLLSQTGIIPARMAGELVPTAATGGGNNSGAGDCSNDGTEGTVNGITLGSPDETTIQEDQSDVELVAFDVELNDDGDLCMDRFDLIMGQSVASDSDKPWDYFTDAHLMVNGEEVDSMSVDSSSDWSEYAAASAGTLGNGAHKEYRLRFSGLDAGLMSDETSTVSVSFDTVNNLDSADEDAVWYFGTETDSFRFTDGTGFTFTDGANLEDTFAFENADTAGLTISSGDNDPDAMVIQVDRTADTNGVDIGEFDIEETEGVDVNITEMDVVLATSDTITDVVKKLYLYDGSTLVGQENVTGLTVTFDNIDLDVDADDTVTLTVQADFDDTNENVRYQNGDTIQVASVDLTEYTDEKDNDEGDFTESGSYASEVHGLYSEGIDVEVTSATTTITDDGDGATFVSGAEYQWVVEVTAFGDEDVYINKDIADIVASGGAAAGDVDDIYTVEVSTGAAITGLSGTITSSATAVTGDSGAYTAAYNGETFYKIGAGDTETFTITVTGINQTQSKQTRATLDNIEWTTDLVDDSSGASDGGTATINSYTFNLGEDAATPFKAIN